MQLRAPIVIASFLALVACDAPKREEITGLQARLDILAAEQAELHKHDDAAAETVRKLQETVTAQVAALDAAKREIAANTTRIDALQAKLDAMPAPRVAPLAAGRPDPAERYRVVLGDAMVEGAADAKVTIVIFSDFQCPFCGRVQNTLDEVQKHYGGDVRVVAKHNPLPMHPRADAAAKAAEAAGKQGKFWEMHDVLYANLKALGETDIEKYATDLKLDLKQFRADLGDTGIRDRIEADKKQARELGALGTPAFFLNGKYLSGAQPFESFRTAIDAEIKEADRLLAAGTTRSGLYDALMATAKPGPGLGR